MVEAARAVERAGADFIVICTNTMHKTANDIERHVNIPLLHIADATADELIDKAQVALDQTYEALGMVKPGYLVMETPLAKSSTESEN